MKIYLGFMASEILWGLMVLVCALILYSGVMLYKFSQKEDDKAKSKTLAILSYMIMGASGLVLFILLLPILINSMVWILGHAVVGEIIDELS